MELTNVYIRNRFAKLFKRERERAREAVSLFRLFFLSRIYTA